MEESKVVPNSDKYREKSKNDPGVQPYEKKKVNEKMKDGTNEFLHYVTYVENVLPKVRNVVNAVLDICNAIAGTPTNNYRSDGYFNYGASYNRSSYYNSQPSYRQPANGYSTAGASKAPSNEILFRLDQGKVREDAEVAYNILLGIMENKTYVTMADFYNVCRCPCDYTYESWGWYRLPPRSDIYKVPEGFVLRMPKEVPIH